jgi:hypothetical protein
MIGPRGLLLPGMVAVREYKLIEKLPKSHHRASCRV